MNRVAFGEITGLARKRGPVFVYASDPEQTRRGIAISRCPQRVTAIHRQLPALSVRRRIAEDSTATCPVALGGPPEKLQTLALSC
jgi:hypothetical protein